MDHSNFSNLSNPSPLTHLEPEGKPLWELFCLTGEPLAYMLYRSMEEAKENDL